MAQWGSPTELAVNRANTLAFILANPTDLVLIPRTRVKTGTGTKWVSGAPRAAQTLRVIAQGTGLNPAAPGLVRAADGIQRRVEYQLLGEHTAIMDLWDTWTDADGIPWEIAELLPENGYEIRAQVIRYGEG